MHGSHYVHVTDTMPGPLYVSSVKSYIFNLHLKKKKSTLNNLSISVETIILFSFLPITLQKPRIKLFTHLPNHFSNSPSLDLEGL